MRPKQGISNKQLGHLVKGYSGQSMMLTSNHYLLLWLRMNGVLLPLSPYASAA
jgi:hypothetical protein